MVQETGVTEEDRVFFLRLLSSIVLVSLFLFSIFSKSSYAFSVFAFFSIALTYIGLREFLKMLYTAGRVAHINTVPALGAVVTASVVYSASDSRNLFLGIFVIMFFICQCWFNLLMSRNKIEELDKILHSSGAFFMFIIPMAVMAYIYTIGENGRYLLLFLVTIAKSGDIGAYVTGTLSSKIMPGGNHKIVPLISPGKSWEGTCGGMILSVSLSVLLCPYMIPNSDLVSSLLLGFFIFILGFAGDLTESALKRICGVKDSGKGIPGIGGVFDLVDSFIFAAPTYLLYLFAAEIVRWKLVVLH